MPIVPAAAAASARPDTASLIFLDLLGADDVLRGVDVLKRDKMGLQSGAQFARSAVTLARRQCKPLCARPLTLSREQGDQWPLRGGRHTGRVLSECNSARCSSAM